MFAKLSIVLLAVVSAALGGVLKDFTGGTYDLTTGQYSSAITGRVYNTAPYGYASPYVPAYGYAAPYALASPYVYGGLYR
ncbi:cuticle protein 7 [Galendromus occidentalis]|uniref:Cuticle protein 7 n=1 Tax=Galendromus occidentalis TaxID=34638 RepID=A0AAJ7PB41_9ACAR|nr:cuticle protein 7 [Galendromus occidentalis]